MIQLTKRIIKIVAIDETQYWIERLAQYGPICGIYLVDTSLQTFCCELTPSYELYHLYNLLDHYNEVPEDIVEEIDEEGYTRESAMYIHCAVIDRAKNDRHHHEESQQIRVVHEQEFDFNPAERDYQEFIEELRESFTCNHVI